MVSIILSVKCNLLTEQTCIHFCTFNYQLLIYLTIDQYNKMYNNTI